MWEATKQYIRTLISRGLSHHTITAYKKDILQLYEFLKKYSEDEKVDLNGITRLYLRDFLRELSLKGRNNRTLARKATTIKNFFQYCEKNKLVIKNPAVNLQIPKFDKTLPQYFSEKEMEALLNIPELSTKFGVRNKAILELIYSCGMRISEIADCRINQIDLNT